MRPADRTTTRSQYVTLLHKSLLCGALLCLTSLCLTACTRDTAGDTAAFDVPDAKRAPFQGDAAPVDTLLDAGAFDALRRQADSGSEANTGGEDSAGTGDNPDAAEAQVDPEFIPSVCTAGAQKCEGALLATCSPAKDGWSVSPCFPGQYCRAGACRPIENNLLIAFDTSGSMKATVKGKSCTKQTFPKCDPTKSCTRMAVSKVTFGKALADVDAKTNRLALFHFPQRIYQTTATSCDTGHYAGLNKVSGDELSEQSVDANSGWFWSSLHQIMSVPFPTTEALAAGQKKQIARWMDGAEKLQATAKACSNPSSKCATDPVCGGGACCAGKCHVHAEPELRANGTTPIGKTLFYIGEYFRNRIVIDGKACIIDSDCANPNYRCAQGYCVDPAAACRENVVVLFTDGGENNDPTNYFAPQVSAKRLRYGLACKTINDCAGEARCKNGRCLPDGGTDYHCVATSQACKPGITDKSHVHYCPPLPGKTAQCLPDALGSVSAKAKYFSHNVLRSPDGNPFSVRVHVVDISDAADLSKSFYIAIAGGGRMLTADAADASAFLGALQSALDMKNEKVCGSTDAP